MSVKPGLRFAVLERDGFRCVYCGATSLYQLQVDHVIAASDGGPDDFWNLVTACATCNQGKSDSPPSPGLMQFVQDHINNAGAKRSLELMSGMQEVLRVVSGKKLEELARILPNPYWPRESRWMDVLRARLYCIEHGIDPEIEQ